ASLYGFRRIQHSDDRHVHAGRRRVADPLLQSRAWALDSDVRSDHHAAGVRFFALPCRTLRLEQSGLPIWCESALDAIAWNRLLHGRGWHQPFLDPADDSADAARDISLFVDQ